MNNFLPLIIWLNHRDQHSNPTPWGATDWFVALVLLVCFIFFIGHILIIWTHGRGIRIVPLQ